VQERELRCVICDAEMPFEVPPCTDGHGADCPELVCTRCDAAEILAPLEVRVWLRPDNHRIAPLQRRAA
jgi:hypothetical protein